MARIEAQRIGTGLGYFIAAGVTGLIGVWGTIAGDRIGLMFLLLAAGLVGVGFWIRLFGLVERRLMDIQAAVTPGATVPEDASRKPGKDPLGVDHLF